MISDERYGIKKFSYEVEFIDGTKFRAIGQHDNEEGAFDFEYKNLNDSNKVVHIEDEQCEELAKMFYAFYKTYKEIQGNETDTYHEFNMDNYEK